MGPGMELRGRGIAENVQCVEFIEPQTKKGKRQVGCPWSPEERGSASRLPSWGGQPWAVCSVRLGELSARAKMKRIVQRELRAEERLLVTGLCTLMTAHQI